MIKVENGEIEIDGKRIDLVFEFNLLLRTMAKYEPVILAVSIAQQTDAIQEEFLKAKDAINLAAVEEVVKGAIHVIEVSNK